MYGNEWAKKWLNLMSVCVIMHVYGYVCVGECVRVKAYMFVNVRVRVYANQKNNNEKHTHTIFFEKLPQGMVAAVVRTS